MSLYVQKYGGTSVGSIERIQAIAAHIAQYLRTGSRLVIVVSAMGEETDRMLSRVRQITATPDPRELDALLATGEQHSAALLCIALRNLDIAAFSYTGAQLPIRTYGEHMRAKIHEVCTDKLRFHLQRNEIPVVAGFQGVNQAGDITTLGRGGSDISAVALAAALGADECQIYTDVNGVYTADPRIVPQARRLRRLTLEEMLEMSGQGAKVLQIRSVEMAGRNRIPLRVLSSMNPDEGTEIIYDGQEDKKLETPLVSGITQNRNEAKLSIRGLRDIPGMAAKILGDIAARDIAIDMIVQNNAADGLADLSFTLDQEDLPRAQKTLCKVAEDLGAKSVDSDENIAKLSLVGAGMRSHAGIAEKMFNTLGEQAINIQMIATSEIKITVIIAKESLDQAVRALHASFDLQKEPENSEANKYSKISTTA